MLRKKLYALTAAVAVAAASLPALADGLDGPDMYVYVEVSVREITIEGMRQRLALLQSSQYTIEADNAIDAQTRIQIADVYAQFGTTPGAHVVYATHNADAIAAWLGENSTWQERYTALDTQFRSLSDQLSAARRAP